MLFSFVLLSCLCFQTVHSWGDIGHALVAEIAQSLLTNDSLVFIRNHLPWYTNGNLSMLASWPDTIIYPNTNPVDYLNWQWSKQLHYVNTPDWNCAYDRIRDCNWTSDPTCVDGAIRNYTGRLAAKKQDDIQRGEALKFLVHFIGDAHQPLHAGFASDRGGNDIFGTFYGKNTDLHKIWDTGIINRRISSDFPHNITEYYYYLLNTLHTKYANNITVWSTCPSSDQSPYSACSTAWIEEDAILNCAIVYRDENERPLNASEEFHFSDIYYQTRIVYLEQRLLQAGVRLSVVINNIVRSENQHHHHHHKSNDQIYISLFFLFLGVCFIFLAIINCIHQRNSSRDEKV